MRPSSDVLLRSQHPQSMLWSLGISGDLPIVVVRIDEVEDLEIVRQLFRAHEYWRMKQLAVDLVIVNERPSSYVQELQASLEALVRANQSRPSLDGEGTLGGVFVLRGDMSVDRGAQLASECGACCAAQPPRKSLAANQTAGEIGAALHGAGQTSPGRGESIAAICPVETGTRILQRSGWFRSRWARIRDHPWRGTVDPGALDQRHCQRHVWLSGIGFRLWIHVVDKQPREPDYSVVKRPRQRPSRRGNVRSRRGQRRGLGSHRLADSRGVLLLYNPARPRL